MFNIKLKEIKRLNEENNFLIQNILDLDKELNINK